jgi:redox-sensing transcriptional repressor
MKRFPPKTITRALLYIRILDDLISNQQLYVSSQFIADLTGLTDAQVRKDISNFGTVGRPRIGYKTKALKDHLEAVVLKHTVHAVLFGVGNLGSAILKYPGFQTEKIKLVAAFDRDPRMIGKDIKGVHVYSIDEALRIIPRTHAEIGIIAVPPHAGQEIAETIVAAGLKGIVNFAPVTVNVPKGINVRDIDLSIEFLSLFYDITS